MQVKVQIGDSTETVDVSLDALTLRESVEVQKAIGNAEWDELVGDTEAPVRPATLLAIIIAKLRHRFPDIDVNSVEADYFGPAPTVDEDEGDPTETG